MNAASLIIVIASNAGHWLSGTDGTVTASWTAREGAVPARLVWELRLDGAPLAKDSVTLNAPKVPEGAGGGAPDSTFKIRCPDVRARTTLQLRWQIEPREGGEQLGRGDLQIYAYPPDLTAGWDKLLQGRHVVVIDKRDGLPAILSSAKVEHTRLEGVARLALERPGVILIGPEALDASPFDQAPLIELARAGASVMAFRQTGMRVLAGYPLSTRAAPPAIEWERRHPLLARFEEADLASWLESWRREGSGNLTGVMELPADEPAMAVAAWDGVPRAAGDPPGPVTALLMTRTIGKGRLVLCQMPLGDWRTDPRAQQFLSNALDYLVSPPEPTPRPSERRRPDERPTAPVPTITIPSGDKR